MITKYKSIFLIFLINSIVTGCNQSNIRDHVLDVHDYRSKLKIKVYDREYYSSSYVGKRANKYFPPITNNIHRRFNESHLKGLEVGSPSYNEIKSLISEKLYSEKHRLDIERVVIQLEFPGAIFDKNTKEILHLVAADVALQRGFPYVTRVTEGIDANCATTYSTTTRGSVNLNTNHYGNIAGNQIYGTSMTSGNYDGRTTLNEDVYCIATSEGEFMLFKNPDDLKNGVFLKNRYSGKLDPVTALYYGTTPNVLFIDHPPEKEIKVNTRKMVIDNAWKNGYVASSLSKDIRTKHNIVDTAPYKIIEEKEQKRMQKIKRDKKDAENPMLRNRLNQ